MFYFIIILLKTFYCTTGKYELIDIQDGDCTGHDGEGPRVEFKTDFNYNEFSLMNIKMPFINCNRNIITGPGIDIVDMFILGNRDLANQFLLGINVSLSRISSILDAMRNILDSKDFVNKEEKDSAKIIDGNDTIIENNTVIKSIHNRLLLLRTYSEHTSYTKEIISIFEYIDKYLFDGLGIDLYIFELKNPQSF